MIDQRLAEFLHEGVGIHVGTRDAQLEPNGARAIAARVEPGGTHVVIYMARRAAERVLPDLESNGHAAVVFGRPTDDRSCQLKGVFVEARQARPDEEPHTRAQWNAFLDNLEHIGIPRASVTRWYGTPEIAIRLRATAVFDQTPGPNAGKPLS